MKKTFFAGLVTLLPLAITFWVISFLVRFLTKPFIGIVTSILTSFPTIKTYAPKQLIQVTSQLLILVAIFLFLLLLGLTARLFFLRSLIWFGDYILHKIPLINKIYKTSKEVVQSLFSEKKNSFKQTVLFPFPHARSYSLGLVADQAPTTCNESIKEELTAVFVPTTPNPTTGLLVMCKKKDLIFLDIHSEAAIKYVVSCAVIQPEEKG